MGNFPAGAPDQSGVECETCRKALSARLDGEQEPVPAERADEHLLGCTACQAWQQQAIILTRTLRVRPATATPDLTDQILAAVSAADRGWWWRAALGGVAIAQLGLGLGQLLGVDTGMTSPSAAPGDMSAHLFDESTAWNVALGIGMLWVALRSRAAAGMLPVFGGFLALLTAFSVHDLIVGDVPVARVVSHGLLVAGFALMCVVHRQGRQRDDGLPWRAATASDVATTVSATIDDAPPPRNVNGRPLRPAGRRQAA